MKSIAILTILLASGICSPAYAHRLTGEASIYTHGSRTASGERYSKTAMTAAHFSLPFNTLVLVTNTENGKSAVVRINDRGPFWVAIRRGRISRINTRKPHQKFVIDMTPAGAKAIGLTMRQGHVPVRLTVLGRIEK